MPLPLTKPFIASGTEIRGQANETSSSQKSIRLSTIILRIGNVIYERYLGLVFVAFIK